MNLQETEEHNAFRAEVRAFVEQSLPDDIRHRVLNFMRVERDDYVRWQKILFERGWGAPGWPVEYGGPGWDAVRRNIFEEACFAGGAPRQIPFGLSMVGPVVQKFGNESQKRRFLPKIIASDEWWCQGYSEPGAGSDLASLRTRATRDGGTYIVNGAKTWTTYAHYADWIFCLVRTSTEGRPQTGISFLLIDMKTPGITVRPIITLDQGHDVNDVFFDNVVVPAENLIGEENQGWTYAKYLLGHERTTIAGVGMCRRLLRRLKEVAREVAKDDRPLVDDVRFRDKIARLEIDLLIHEWSLRRAISLEANRQQPGPEPSMLKIRGSEIQQQLAELLMECAGPHALPYVPEALDDDTRENTAAGPTLNALAALYFDMRKVSIYGGTSEVQRGIISKMALGL